MTRQEVLDTYEVNADGVIKSPGKFEGEMLYVPHFWERGLEGGADLDIANVWAFEVLNKDVQEFPELAGINTIALEESEMGFVYSKEYQSLAICGRELEAIEEEFSEDEDEPEDEENEAEEFLEPEEGDITTTDHQHFYQYGKLVLTIGEDADYKAELKRFMDAEKFWPNCWFVSDHGNAHLMSLDEENS